MDLKGLEAFEATFAAGSMSRGALRLGITQGAMSQRLQQLEAELGGALFDRVGRGVIPTELGRAFAPRAMEILARVRALEAQVRSDLREGVGRIVIGAIPTMAPYLLARVIAHFSARNPRCEVEVREQRTEHLLEAIAAHEVDLGVLSTPGDHPLVEVDVVAHEHFWCVWSAQREDPAPDGHLTPAAIAEHPLVVLDESHCLGRQVSTLCTLTRTDARIRCRATQLETVLALVRLGLGVAIVPQMACRDLAPDLCARAIDDAGAARDIAIAHRRGRRFGPLAGDMIAAIRTTLEADGARAYGT